MGYYTKYELKIVSGDQDTKVDCPKCKTPEAVAATVLEAICAENSNIEIAMSGEPLKWYDWKKDMLRICSEWPDRVFQLQGVGEESGDIWVAWFRNGKMQEARAKIELPTAPDPAGFE